MTLLQNRSDLRTRTLALLIACCTGCASVRPAKADEAPLSVSGEGSSWSARLGDDPIGKPELFRAAGYDAIAEQIDSDRQWAWGGLTVFAAMSAATVGFAYGFSKTREGGGDGTPFMVGALLTGVWSLSSGIVTLTRFTAPGPGGDLASSAAESHNARRSLLARGVALPAPKATDTPDIRARLESWLLRFHEARGAEKAQLGVEGFKLRDQLQRIGLGAAALALQVDEAFAAAGDDAPLLLDRAHFALNARDPEVLRRTDAALTASVPAKRDPDLWIALGDVRQARGERAAALDAYRSAVEIAPQSLVALKPYGRALANAGRRREAVELWSKALLAIDSDAERFALLDAIGSVDRAWLHANQRNLPEGLVPAYREHQEQRAAQRRLSSCLSTCGGIEWESLRRACEADCYAVTGS